MGQLVQLDSLNKVLTVSVTDSPLSVTNIAQMAIKLTILNDFRLEEVPTGQSLDSFYVTDSPLCVTNIAQMAIFI